MNAKGWGDLVLDPKDCNCDFSFFKRNTQMDAKRWGGAKGVGVGDSNLSVHWALTVRNSYFDSPLNRKEYDEQKKFIIAMQCKYEIYCTL